MARVLVACEFSGIVTRAFRSLGHTAYSCDILPCENVDDIKTHIVKDVREIFTCGLYESFDLMVAHPFCTYLAVSGARWFYSRKKEQEAALDFVRYLMNVDVKHIAIENPISVISTKIKKPDQIIQPWMFGHGETKATCLWLKNLPLLKSTNIVDGRVSRIHHMAPSKDRTKERSRTYKGIAEAMATQWGAAI